MTAKAKISIFLRGGKIISRRLTKNMQLLSRSSFPKSDNSRAWCMRVKVVGYDEILNLPQLF